MASIENILSELEGDHSWIPGAVFKTTPGLQEYLIAAIKYFPRAQTFKDSGDYEDGTEV